MADATIYNQARSQLGGALAALRAATKPTEKMAAITVVMRILGNMASHAPTEQLRETWLAAYRRLEPQAATLRAQVTYDPPGAVLRALDKFSDAVLNFGGEVLDGAGGIIAAAPGVLKAAPWIILAVVAALVIVTVKVGPQLLGAYKRKK